MQSLNEIEVKLLKIDIAQLRKRLATLKARRIFTGRIHDWQFDTKDWSLRDDDKLLRLRRYGSERLELVFKGPRQDSGAVKQRQEITLVLEQAEQPEHVTEFLSLMGYNHAGYQEKDRDAFQLGAAVVVIDQYPHIPAYAEVEAENEILIEETIMALGLAHAERSTLSANEVYKMHHPQGNFSDLHF